VSEDKLDEVRCGNILTQQFLDDAFIQHKPTIIW
jgi:hypothetical protein